MSKLFLNIQLIIWFSIVFIDATSLIVEIKNGTIKGSLMKTRKGREIFAFRGIPYALPPIGQLRFKPPEPSEAWSGVLLATKDANVCIQRSFLSTEIMNISSEDCLYLNVFTPELTASKSKERYPVMIWIHGGGWHEGSGHSDFNSPAYFLDYDVVFVTINYRLGALGFLSTQDMVSPGNYGMKDQVQSIRWVVENIAAFNGDPNSITIFGESAGGASVNYHMNSPLSKGLFQRAISQSGTLLSPWTFNNKKTAVEHAIQLGNHLNCSSINSETLVTCLRNKNANDIVNSDSIFKVFGMDPMIPFRVVIEPKHHGAFLTEDPTELQISDIPFMVGTTSHEGSPRVFELYNSQEKNFIKLLNDKWLEFAPITLMYQQTHDKKNHDKMSKKIRDFYLENKIINNSSKFNLITMYSDLWTNFGTHMSVKHHFENFGSPVFYYEFSYKGKTSLIEAFGSKEDYGVSHTDDLLYLFPLNKFMFSPDIKQSKEDEKMIDVLINMWYNFAKYGNPTPDVTEQLPVKWKPVRSKSLEYFSIKSPNKMMMLKNLNKKRMKFLESLPRRKRVVSLSKKIKNEL